MSKSLITSAISSMFLGLLSSLPITLLMYSSTCSLYNFIEYLIRLMMPSMFTFSRSLRLSFSS